MSAPDRIVDALTDANAEPLVRGLSAIGLFVAAAVVLGVNLWVWQ